MLMQYFSYSVAWWFGLMLLAYIALNVSMVFHLWLRRTSWRGVYGTYFTILNSVRWHLFGLAAFLCWVTALGSI